MIYDAYMVCMYVYTGCVPKHSHTVPEFGTRLHVNMATERELKGREMFRKIAKPERILLFSGKRKSGKDYITDILYNRYCIDIL